ncbi:MAG: diguanylate cyclase [bacterium]|nr:diguanylate cyclase [bacterium]
MKETLKWRSVTIRFLLIFLPLVFFLTGLSTIYYLDEIDTQQRLLANREAADIAHAQKSFHFYIRGAVTDLLVLTKHHELFHLLNGEDEEHLQALAEEFFTMAVHNGLYDQIRYLDDTGMEIVRINFNVDGPAIVPVDKLQNIGHRRYFSDTFALGKGEIFVSPFALNIEKGGIKQLLKPMIRVGVPIFDRKGEKHGVLLLDVLGADMLHNFEDEISSQAMLVNSDGYWLKGLTPEDEWGFIYEDRKDRVFRNRFPDAWGKISESDNGQFVNTEGMFTFFTVQPLLEGLKSSTDSGEMFGRSSKTLKADDYYWKAISYVQAARIAVNSRAFLNELLSVNAMLIILFAVISWLLARTQINHALAQHRLRESELRHRSVTQTANDAIISADIEGNIVFWNRGAQSIFGYKEEDVLNQPVTMLMPERYHDAHIQGIERVRATGVLRSGGKTVDLRGIRKDGCEFAAELSLAYWTTADGEINYTSIIRDSSKREQMEQELRELATTDGLTGLFNRNYFDKKLGDEYRRAARYQEPLSLLIIDIDFFKSINDRYGHQAGDAYLVILGALILEVIRDIDTAARYGGEEFVVIMPNTNSNGAKLAAERLREQAANKKVSFDGHIIKRTISIGVASLGAYSEMTVDALIKTADEALYAAKEGGRNRVTSLTAKQ